jgi:hypothetical protein
VAFKRIEARGCDDHAVWPRWLRRIPGPSSKRLLDNTVKCMMDRVKSDAGELEAVA